LNIDLGSSVLDIAIALAFVFFLLSLIVSAVREFVAGVLGLRGKTLAGGIEGMLGDATIAEKVMKHPLVRTDLRKGAKKERKPSYVSPRNFSIALKNVLKEVPKGDQAKDLRTQIEALSHEFLPNEDPPISSIEKWFNDSMERVSGWYKRRSQYWMAFIAVVIAVGLNASTIRIVERFESEPSLRDAVAKQAQQAVEKGDFKKAIEEETKKQPNAVEQIEGAGKQGGEAVENVNGLKLPLWWSSGNAPQGVSQWAISLLGWLITAIAISLGAPFWFDALGKLANLRMAGKNPEEKAAR
jgi:hypothetical protein